MKNRDVLALDRVDAVDELAEMVASALQTADALQLWDVSIGLDRARLAVEKLRSERVLQAPLCDSASPSAETRADL